MNGHHLAALPIAISLQFTSPCLQADDCAEIDAAMGQRNFQPGYYRLLEYSVAGTPHRNEMILAGGRIYMREGDEAWELSETSVAELQDDSRKIPFGARLCRRVADEVVPQGAASVYEFVNLVGQPSRVWIGVKDRLPYQVTSENSKLTYTYGDVKAPIVAAKEPPPMPVMPLKVCPSGRILEGTMSGEILAFGAQGGAVRLRFGMTKAEVVAASQGSGVPIDKATPDEWRIGDEVFIFENDRLTRYRGCSPF